VAPSAVHLAVSFPYWVIEDTVTAIEWDDDTFERILERLATEGTIDATGARISSERLARILEEAPEDPDRPRSSG
jgi:hypothetical protein